VPGKGGANASTRRCWLASKRSRDSVAKMTGGQAEMSEILAITGGSSLAAMIVEVPPQWGTLFRPQELTAIHPCIWLIDVEVEHPFERPAQADRRRGWGASPGQRV